MGYVMENLERQENRIQEAIRFLREKRKRVILYGAGYCGHETLALFQSQQIPVVAICDDYRAGQELDGIPISSITEITPDHDTVICITSGFYKTMKENLKRLHLLPFYMELDFGRYEPQKETYAYFAAHEEEIETARQLLEDSFSRRLFLNLCNYRISRKAQWLDGMESTQQYFPREVKLDLHTGGGIHSFLDLGAFDGDSIRGFIEYVHGTYECIIAVEANEKNYRALLRNTASLAQIECHLLGVYKEKGRLRFSVNDAKNAFLSRDGGEILEVDTVDHIVNGRRITFIKMDIEGAEYDAILGAEKTIRKNTPAMAISVYHKVEDLWRILLLLQKIHPHYVYYLRHYSPTVIETVLYAVPRKEGAVHGQSI